MSSFTTPFWSERTPAEESADAAGAHHRDLHSTVIFARASRRL
jgi:hypothetical protein